MAKLVDLSLNGLSIAGLPNYENEFGTKKSNGVGLSTEEITNNDLIGFRHQRAIIVNENIDCTTFPVDSDRKFLITQEGAQVKIPKATYAGCTLIFWVDVGNGSATVKFESSADIFTTIEVFDGKQLTIRSKVGGYFSTQDELDASCPKDFVYTQYPNQKAPWEVWSFTSQEQWENISSQYAGDFFRAEGGNASGFGSGEQPHGICDHTHQVFLDGHNQWPIRLKLSWSDGSSDESLVFKGDYSEARQTCEGFNLYTGSNRERNLTAIETRPVNQTIRIWKRIA